MLITSIIMLRAVTNRDFPMLKAVLSSLFDMELDVDTSIRIDGRLSIYQACFSSDPLGRFRIYFVDNTSDLSYGRAGEKEVTGHSFPWGKIALIAVPDSVSPVTKECRHKSGTIDGFLVAVALHELYEVLTGDFSHCDHPRKCINAECAYYVSGTCSACLGDIIDKKYPDLKLRDLYCREHLRKLKAALKKYSS
jgi:hypothetical protein